MNESGSMARLAVDSRRAYPRERFSREVTLTPSEVAAFATAAGDDNALHHNALFAAATRYRRPIASGPHTLSLLIALTAAHFGKKGAMIGLEFSARFHRPVYADETIRLEWMVVKVTANVKLGGDVVDLRGRVKGQDGNTAIGAKVCL